jgi:hypothetical protein
MGGAAGGESSTYRALDIAVGRYHSCALMEDHQVKCWGYPDYGQLGLGDLEPRGLSADEMGDALPPVDLGTGRTAKAIAAGRYRTCAILDDDSLKCWGISGYAGAETTENAGDDPGEMGDALPIVPLGAGVTAIHVAAGAYGHCVATSDQRIVCWGLGAGEPFVDQALESPVVSLQGCSGALAWLEDGSVWRLDPLALEPEQLHEASDGGIVAVAASMQTDCLLLEDDRVRCFGSAVSFPATLPDAQALTLSELGYPCALLDTGQVECWGAEMNNPAFSGAGQVGDARIALGEPATKIAAGFHHQCALLGSGGVKCWYWEDAPSPLAGASDPQSTTWNAIDLGSARP